MLNETLEYLFPLNKRSDWILQDETDGKGPYIKEWNRPEPRPDKTEILTAEPAAMEAKRKADLKEYAVNTALRRGAKMLNPQTGKPLSTETDPDRIRIDLFNAEQYSRLAEVDTAVSAKEKRDIDSTFKKRIGIMQALVLIHKGIDSGAVVTKADIETDSRWTI